MKKLITILFLSAFTMNAQIEDDKINHFAVSYIGSFAITGITYHWLSEYTDIPSVPCKIIAGVLGAGIMTGIGYAKEKTDTFFNPYDMEANKLGAFAGTISFEFIIFKSISERQYKKRQFINIE